jgi:hypothetical protein
VVPYSIWFFPLLVQCRSFSLLISVCARSQPAGHTPGSRSLLLVIFTAPATSSWSCFFLGFFLCLSPGARPSRPRLPGLGARGIWFSFQRQVFWIFGFRIKDSPCRSVCRYLAEWVFSVLDFPATVEMLFSFASVGDLACYWLVFEFCATVSKFASDSLI